MEKEFNYYVNLIFEEEHYNANAACTIPAAWVAFVETREGESFPKWPCGDTEQEAVEYLNRELGKDRWLLVNRA